MNDEIAYIHHELHRAYETMMNKAALYGCYAEQTNGITRTIWQAKSSAMAEAAAALRPLHSYMADNHAMQAKRPALTLAAVNPDATSTGRKAKLSIAPQTKENEA